MTSSKPLLYGLLNCQQVRYQQRDIDSNLDKNKSFFYWYAVTNVTYTLLLGVTCLVCELCVCVKGVDNIVSLVYRSIEEVTNCWDQSLEETVVQVPEGKVQTENDRHQHTNEQLLGTTVSSCDRFAKCAHHHGDSVQAPGCWNTDWYDIDFNWGMKCIFSLQWCSSSLQQQLLNVCVLVVIAERLVGFELFFMFYLYLFLHKLALEFDLLLSQKHTWWCCNIFQDAFEILTKYEADVTQEEAEMVHDLRRLFTKLQTTAVSEVIMSMIILVFVMFPSVTLCSGPPQTSVQDELCRMQPKFKEDLLSWVTVLQNDIGTFMEQYESVCNLWIHSSNSVCVCFQSMYTFKLIFE